MGLISLRSGILVCVACASVALLLALMAPTRPAKSDEQLPPVEVVAKRGFFSELLDIQPRPLADCDEIREWLVEHPRAFHAVTERPGFAAELQYRPAVCMACLEQPSAKLSDPEFQKRQLELAGGDIYHLRISAGKEAGLIPRASLAWQQQIVQVLGSDTMPCAFVHVETLPPGLPYQSVVLGFDASDEPGDRSVIITDGDGTLGGDLVLNFPKGGGRALGQAIQPTETKLP